VLDDYESDEDAITTVKSNDQGVSAATRALLDQLNPKSEQEETAEISETKIIFCSRTHSQLTQFVHELQRVHPPRGISTSEPADQLEPVKHLALGSRKTLCINEKVSRLTSTAAINERCLELQKSGLAQDKKCQYLPDKEKREIVETFKDRAIAHIKDIEDLAQLGKELHICPYYASRPAIAPSEVVTLPYPLLLQKSAREALGVSVKDNIVVIDEAHNLMDAIADTLSVSMTLVQLQTATQQVTNYVQRFKNRLKGKNRVYVTQILRLLNSLVDGLQSTAKSLQQQDVSVTAQQLMAGKGVDQIKPHKLLQYLHESKLAHKVEGYTDNQPESNKHKGLLMQFQSLLVALMNPAAEGRFFVSRQEKDVHIRYSLLDPREHFRDVVEEARAVILAGGTMSPMSDYEQFLFSYLPPHRLKTFSFGHVIPKENMFVEAITKGPEAREFDFTFEKRSDRNMIMQLGTLVIKLCQTVPDGIVVFFPSYDYLKTVWNNWTTGPSPLVEHMKMSKPAFQEEKGSSVDDLLRDYTQSIDAGKGGLLLSVVGGKLSEGINFSDKLGRAVVAVGLPFPNANGAEWKAKIQHVEETRYEQCRTQEQLSESEARSKAKAAGREFYENACMRAVNQSIGRAIRHRNDYAAILLVDRRFAMERIKSKLPGWIRGSMNDTQTSKTWPQIEQGLKTFFSSK
jgi:chromosome transmission fidelity protein 1